MQNTRDIGPLLRRRHGAQVRKICLRLGTSCPNRDGTLGTGGCIFCGEQDRPPAPPVAQQLAAGFARFEPGTKAIAYLQDHTATHLPAPRLESVLASIRSHERVVAIHVGTRPDCLPREMVEVLARHATGVEVLVELGLQTANESTLELVGRRHGLGCFREAVQRLHEHGLKVCAHVVLGLPSASDQKQKGVSSPNAARVLVPESARDAVATARLVGSLGVDGVKIHHCHVLRGTPLAVMYGEGRFEPVSLEGYLDRLIAFLEHLPPETEIHRLVGEAPLRQVVAPDFTAKKSHTLQWIRAELKGRGVYQGARWLEGQQVGRLEGNRV